MTWGGWEGTLPRMGGGTLRMAGRGGCLRFSPRLNGCSSYVCKIVPGSTGAARVYYPKYWVIFRSRNLEVL